MVVTLATFHCSKGRLNEEAPRNIPVMVITLATFQPLMSSLKSLISMNKLLMSVTVLVSHSDIGPYFVLAFELFLFYALTALRISSSVLTKFCGMIAFFELEFDPT